MKNPEKSIIVNEEEYQKERFTPVWFQEMENIELKQDFNSVLVDSNEKTIFVGFDENKQMQEVNPEEDGRSIPIYRQEVNAVRRFLEQEDLTEEEENILKNFKDKWWYNKHKSPYKNEISKRYILIKDHAELDKDDEKYMFQKELMGLVEELRSGCCFFFT